MDQEMNQEPDPIRQQAEAEYQRLKQQHQEVPLDPGRLAAVWRLEERLGIPKEHRIGVLKPEQPTPEV
jgi:hypothetical protein